MFSSYKNIWFCGLAASGKTTVLRHINKEFKNIEFLNDSVEIIEFIKKDTKQEHHTKPTPDSFVLTDSQPVYFSIEQLLKKVQASKKNKIIELSRGLDTFEIVDFTYKYLFSHLPEDVKKSSLFVYIYSPINERKKEIVNVPNLVKTQQFLNLFSVQNKRSKDFFFMMTFILPYNNIPLIFFPFQTSIAWKT